VLEKSALQSWFIYLCLLVSGIASFFYIPTLFGLDFLIGSIFTFLLYRLFGFKIAFVHSIIFSFATYSIWGHFYGSTAMLLEFLTVIYLYKKFKISFIMADMIYWLVFGIPFILMTYYYFLDLTIVDSLIVALKDSVNGVFNILLVNLLIFIVSYFFFKKHRQKMHLEDIMFNTILTFFLIPALALFLLEANSDYDYVRTEIQEDSQMGFDVAQDKLNIWLTEMTTILSSQGNFAYTSENVDGVMYLETLSEAIWGVDEIVLTDRDLNVILSYPENRIVHF